MKAVDLRIRSARREPEKISADTLRLQLIHHWVWGRIHLVKEFVVQGIMDDAYPRGRKKP